VYTFTEGTIYISSAYFIKQLTPENTIVFFNLFDTVAVRYNSTHMYQASLEGVQNITQLGDYNTNSTICIYAKYIPSFNETVTVCAKYYYQDLDPNKPATTTSQMKQWVRFFFCRQSLGKEIFLQERQINSLWRFNSDDIRVDINITPDLYYELTFFCFNTNEMSLLSFNMLEVFNIQIIRFPFPIYQTNYAAMGLWVVYTEAQDFGARARRSYFLERYAGMPSDFDSMTLFSDARYIRTLPSAESIDVIIESAKYNSEEAKQGAIPSVIYTLHRWVPLEHRMELLSSTLFYIPLLPSYLGMIYKVESMSELTDNNIVLQASVVNYATFPPPNGSGSASQRSLTSTRVYRLGTILSTSHTTSTRRLSIKIPGQVITSSIPS